MLARLISHEKKVLHDRQGNARIKDFYVYNYGNLEITLSGRTVVFIRQLSEPNPDFIFHKRKYEKISKRLEIPHKQNKFYKFK